MSHCAARSTCAPLVVTILHMYGQPNHVAIVRYISHAIRMIMDATICTRMARIMFASSSFPASLVFFGRLVIGCITLLKLSPVHVLLVTEP